MEFPQRITYDWLRRTLPTLESAEEFDQVLAELRRRDWTALDPPSNFLGMMRALLPSHIRREVASQQPVAA